MTRSDPQRRQRHRDKMRWKAERREVWYQDRLRQLIGLDRDNSSIR